MKITPEMVREAEAHFPFALAEGPTKRPRWQWFADFYNHALENPGAPCPCCNVTPDGDIMDHLPDPPTEAQPAAVDGSTLAAARDAWQASDEGRMLASDINGPVGGEHLRNRLEVAFCAGYDAAIAAQQGGRSHA